MNSDRIKRDPFFVPELPFLQEDKHPETLSIAIPYMKSYHNAITAEGINVAGSIGLFNGAFRELFFVMSHFEERFSDLEQAYFKQELRVKELEAQVMQLKKQQLKPEKD